MVNWEVADMIIAAPRVMADETIATIATPHYANVSAYFINGTNETSAPPDYGMWFTNALQVYPDFLGPIAYLLIFFIPFGMIWMAHGDVRLLCILGLITGAFVLAFLPSTWVAAAVIVMVVSVVALIWRLMRP
jgi:hypothetical protein